DVETGVSLMVMDDGLDTGPIVARVTLALDGTETTPALERTLALMAADLLASSLGPWLAGELGAAPQPDVGVTLTRPFRRADGRPDPSHSATHLARMVRAYQPWPGTWFETELGRIVIWAASAETNPERTGAVGDPVIGGIPADGDGLAIEVADGRLRLLEVQPAGGRRMSAAE